MIKELWRASLNRMSQTFSDAQRIYDQYTVQIQLGLLPPDDRQIAAAAQDKNLAEAERLYMESLELCKAAKAIYNVAVVNYQLGLLKRLCGEIDEAIDYFTRALDIFESLPQPDRKAQSDLSCCYFYLGQMLLDKGDNAGAEERLRSANLLDEALGDRRRQSACQFLLARCR